MKRSPWYVALMAVVCGLAVVGPAFASGGSATGGTNSGGGSGGGGGTKTTSAPTYSSIVLGAAYYSTVATSGTATFGYTADGSYKSMQIDLNSVPYEDGTVLPVRLNMSRPDPTAYYGTLYYYANGTMVVQGGAAHLYVSTANGEVVPDFPLPGTGLTTVYVLDPNNAALVSGTFGAQAKKKGSTDVSP